MGKIADITGQRFGRLRVIGLHHERANNRDAQWICECDCGNIIITKKHSLVTGRTQSCGCLQKELVAKRCHKHGLSRSRIAYIRNGMIQRCSNPNNVGYKNYGGRGISVCNEWKDSMEIFYTWAINNGYEEGLSIERIDNNGNYCPENCKWIPKNEQNNNQRSNNLLTYNGKTKTVSQWGKDLNIKENTIHSRLRKGTLTTNQVLENTILPTERLITFNGETHNIKQWARNLGICYETLLGRLNNPLWTIERAMTTPVKKRRRKGDGV